MNLPLSQSTHLRLNNWLKWAWRENRPMALLGLGSTLFFLLALFGLIVDPRTVLNEPTWIKPMKFGMSSIVYAYTLLWMLTYVEGRQRMISLVSWVTSIGLTIELVLIGFQAARGVRSHFNFTTAFDGAIFSTMGVTILLVWIASLIAAFVLMRQSFTSRPFGLALKIGIVIGVIGAGLGNTMTTPTSAQMDQMQELGGPSPNIGAHSVGVEDGGEGLPIVGWSTEGGDKRVGHFIGLHGLQVLPLAGWFIMREKYRLRESQQMRLIWIAGAAYGGVMAITVWQAVRGQPLITPDALTLSVLFSLIAVLGVATAMTLRGNQHVH